MLIQLFGILAAILAVWIAVIQIRRHRILPPRTYAVYPQTECSGGNHTKLNGLNHDSTSNPSIDHKIQNILVLGGMGWLGQRLVRKIQETRGDKVHIYIFDVVVPPIAQRDPKITYVMGDIRVLGHVENCLQLTPMHIVYHLAGIHSDVPVTKATLHAVNVIGTENIILACKANPHASRLIYTSSALVVLGKDDMALIDADESLPITKDSVTPCLKSISMAERMVLTANDDSLMTCVLRPSVMYGLGDTLLADLLVSGTHRVVVGLGDNLVDFVSVDDVVDAHMAAAERLTADSPIAGSVYNLGGGDPVTLAYFQGSTSEAINHWHQAPPNHMRSWAAYLLALANNMLLSVFNINAVPAFSPTLMAIYQRTLTFSNKKAERYLDYRPAHKTSDVIASIVSTYETMTCAASVPS